MENDTGKGRRGPRKVLRLPEGIAEGESASCLDTGDGEDSGVGAIAQTKPTGQVESWVDFVCRVMDAQKFYKYKLRTVWHPDPLHDHILTDHATIAVQKGLVRGQLNTAQFVDL